MKRPRILVVDDDAQFLRFVTELLTGAGYDARCAGDAFGALALAWGVCSRSCDPRRLHAGKGWVRTRAGVGVVGEGAGDPVLVRNGGAAPGAGAAGPRGGAVGYLEKPLRSANLLWSVKALLEAGDQ